MPNSVNFKNQNDILGPKLQCDLDFLDSTWTSSCFFNSWFNGRLRGKEILGWDRYPKIPRTEIWTTCINLSTKLTSSYELLHMCNFVQRFFFFECCQLLFRFFVFSFPVGFWHQASTVSTFTCASCTPKPSTTDAWDVPAAYSCACVGRRIGQVRGVRQYFFTVSVCRPERQRNSRRRFPVPHVWQVILSVRSLTSEHPIDRHITNCLSQGFRGGQKPECPHESSSIGREPARWLDGPPVTGALPVFASISHSFLSRRTW